MTGSEGNKGGSSVINFSSPYYLHPSDSPKQPSVNEVLIDGNYNDWARDMTNFLFAKNKIDFVDGALKKPATSSSEYKSWMRCDAMLKGWLTTAMEKGIRDSVKYANTSSKIWSLWDESHSIFSFPCCSCNKCTCELGKKITAYLEKQKLYEFLMGLDSDFNVIRTQILATKPVSTLGTAYHVVAEDERQRAISLENQAVSEPTAFKAFQRSCFKLVGYPDWWPGKKDDKAKPKAAYVETGTSLIPGLNEEQYQEFVKFFSRSSNNIKAKPEANMAGNKDDVWVVDSGCTEYITHKSNLLENRKEPQMRPLLLYQMDMQSLLREREILYCQGEQK
uniref:Retrotransposon Copia-like N-terminal domain-containing protein n=1 Tax=Tanacetum cinerariifolium TaxID=118510 RepID=A0A699L7A4_TANCI|nr:hypothetical protein [Tanacetum cinerariifolium]